MKLTFKEWLCDVSFAQYGNGRTAIRLTDAETKQPIATASVNLPDEEMADDEVAIKNWSENEGMLEVLMGAGIVSGPVRFTYSGYVTVPICQLLVEVPK